MPKRAAKKAAATRADSALPRRRQEVKLHGLSQPTFISQSYRSNYCGIYSTGMLLSQLGFPTTRRQALKLFNLKRCNPNYPGARLATIGKVFTSMVEVKNWRWEYYRCFDFTSVSKSMRNHVRTNRTPTLLSFGAVHKNGSWKCMHVAVAIGASENRIELLDPLGTTRFNNSANVWLVNNSGHSISVIGSSYGINSESEAAIFKWTPLKPVFGAE